MIVSTHMLFQYSLITEKKYFIFNNRTRDTTQIKAV